MFDYKLFSRKQLEVISLANKFINISEGSVRSGKTTATNVRWIYHVLDSPHGYFLMSGKSTDSLYRNVVKDVVGMLGKKRSRYIPTAKGGPQLLIKSGNNIKTCYCRGSSKVNSEEDIRGMTIGGWYADEVTLHHESFVIQALSRMSLSGAKAFWTTNPDNPNHKIKKNYIDQAILKGYFHRHFSLVDNLTLSSDYIKNLKAAYTGVWYKRLILGLWCIAEGLIYDMFDEKKHIIHKKDPVGSFEKGLVTCDYGTGNPTVFLLLGINRKTYTALDEYYYDGHSNTQKTDSQYADDLDRFYIKNNLFKNIHPVIVDPSALSFITELKNRNYMVIEADNSVISGIRKVASKLTTNELYIYESCTNLIDEFYSYAWDEKAQLLGEDKPIKKYDHSLDALRYGIYTPFRVAWSANIDIL